ncbi:MAG: hypothetical protein Ta2A_10070 [Treponemataceae bacterium]|nr:MAG: hypothetical protein Ta2A_10070 [Treponemataceae bacterium]
MWYNECMELTQEQFDKIRSHLPRQRENVSMDNLQLVNVLLYVTENGCKWRALPKSCGNWHTVYVRMNRWSESGIHATSGRAHTQQAVSSVANTE